MITGNNINSELWGDVGSDDGHPLSPICWCAV